MMESIFPFLFGAGIGAGITGVIMQSKIRDLKKRLDSTGGTGNGTGDEKPPAEMEKPR